MSGLLVALLLAAPGDASQLSGVPEWKKEEAVLALLQGDRVVASVDESHLAAIYESPGFERARLRNTGAWKALLAQVQRWFNQLAETSGAQTYSNVTRILVLVAALVLGGAVVLRTLRRRAPSGGPSTITTPRAASLELEDPARHLARAEGLLATAPREAIREALLALLSSLERQRFARPDRVKTNHELTAELSARGAPVALVEKVAPLFSWFDRAFYSLEAVPEIEARRFVADVRQLAGGAP